MRLRRLESWGRLVPGLPAPKGAFARGYDYCAATRLVGAYGAGGWRVVGESAGEFAGEDAADVVELGEGFEGGEVVDVDAEDFVAHLLQHGVVELEK